MATSTKLVPFYQRVNQELLTRWRELINQNESMREVLEEAIKDNIQKRIARKVYK